MTSKLSRCAIYTRKSSEEGLEQSFNSLEAQREASHAFVLSQRHEGWIALGDRYDDGGYSGGTMERPALKQLLADILAGKIDTVVVYKVDRLTRSLTDFSKIIEVFDSHGVSFVSVTQAFNTTTSMGRLTLNVLLSFAQFEREVTGERIRDKIAASKKKGMWMGGVVPLGYDCVDRKLIVNLEEAHTVREIFRQYLRLGCVMKLKQYLEHEQIRSKVRPSKIRSAPGGATFSRGALYHLLNNRIYIGETVHRSQSYPGQHEAIVPQGLWNQVSDLLRANNQAHRSGKSHSTTSMLSGIVFDTKGIRFTPTHAVKKGKRYRYYTSQSSIQKTGEKPGNSRFPAQEIERLVTSQVHLLLQSSDKCTAALDGTSDKDVAAERASKLAREWPGLELSKKHQFIRDVLRRVVIGQTKIWIEFNPTRLAEALLGRKLGSRVVPGVPGAAAIRVAIEFKPLHRGKELCLVVPKNSPSAGTPSAALVKAIAYARDWYEKVVSGEIGTVVDLAQKAGVGSTYAKRILRYAILSPEMAESILSGNHRLDLTLQDLPRTIPLDWRKQIGILRQI